MIRKSKLGKRMLAMFLCAALTLTSVTPTFASDVSVTAASQTEESAEPSAVVEETKEADESTADETSGAENEKNAPGGDFQGSSEESETKEEVTPDTKEDTSKAEETEDAPATAEQQEEPSSVTEDAAIAESEAEEVATQDAASEVSSIEILDEDYLNNTAQKVERRFVCAEMAKAYLYNFITEDYYVIRDANNNILSNGYNSGFGSDYTVWNSADGSVKLICTIKDQNGKEISTMGELETGTYTVEYSCGDVKTSYELVCKTASDMAQDFQAEGTQVSNAKNMTLADTLYAYTPETTGTCYLDTENYAGSIRGFYQKDGYTVELNTDGTFDMTEGVTYYFMFYQMYDTDKNTVALRSVNAVSSIAITPGSQTYLTRFDTPFSDWKLSVTYADGSSRTYAIASMGSGYANGHNCKLDAYKNRIYYDLENTTTSTSYWLGSSLDEGSYTVKFYLSEDEATTATEYSVEIKDGLDDANWPEAYRIHTGETAATIKAGTQQVIYKFTADKDSEYVLTYDSTIDSFSLYDEKYDSCEYESRWMEQVRTARFSLKKGDARYFCFWINPEKISENDLNFTVSLDAVPTYQSISISAENKDITVVKGDYISLPDISYTITYDDGSETNNTVNFGNDFVGLYGEYYQFKVVDSNGTAYYRGQNDIPVGDYQVAVYDTKGTQIAVCDNLKVHIVDMSDLAVGSLKIGDNAIVATDWDSDKLYYAFTPETTGYYYFDNANQVQLKYLNEYGGWNSKGADMATKLSAGETYYFYFIGSKWDSSKNESSYSYTVTLKTAKEITSIEKSSGRTTYITSYDWDEFAFRDWTIKITDKNNDSYEMKLNTVRYETDWSGLEPRFYLLDKQAGVQLRYELHKEDNDEKLYLNDSLGSVGTYILTLYTSEEDTKGTSFTVKVVKASDYDWTGLDLVEGENSIDPDVSYYRFIAKEDGAYNFTYNSDDSASAYVENDEGRLEWHGFNNKWSETSDEIISALQTKKGDSYYIKFRNTKHVTIEKCPVIEKFTLVTDDRTNTSLLANAEDRNTVGHLKAELTYSNGVTNTITMQDDGYVDGEYNGLVLELVDASGNVHHFADALPAGTYTVRAKMSDADVYSDNTYTVTVKELKDLAAGNLTVGDNTVKTGFSDYKDSFSSSHLYTFTPDETASYRFSPAAQIAVYTKDADGNLEYVGTYGSYSNSKATDVVIPLEKGVTYYLSMTGYIRNLWYEKEYGYTMNISAEAAIDKVEITGKMPYDTFYTGGGTRKEIEDSVAEAVKELKITYADGTTKTAAADDFDIDYPEEFYTSGTFKLDVTVSVHNVDVRIPEAFSVKLLSEDEALSWDVAAPLKLSYDGTGVKKGQGLLYKLTGYEKNTTYKFVTRNDVGLFVAYYADGMYADTANGSITYKLTADNMYMWIKPSTTISSATVTALVQKKPVSVTAKCVKSDLHKGIDRLQANDVILTFTYENGESFSRYTTSEDYLGCFIEDSNYYNIFEDGSSFSPDVAGKYTFFLYDNSTGDREVIDGGFEVKDFDETSVKSLTTGTDLTLSEDTYTFTPSEDGVYYFQNTKEPSLRPAFTYYVKGKYGWELYDEYAAEAALDAGKTYVIRIQAPAGTWKLVRGGDKPVYDDSKPVKSVSVDTKYLYYNYYNGALDGWFTVNFTDGTSTEMYLGSINWNKYLDYATVTDDDTLTFYLRYRADENAAWTTYGPVVYQTSWNKESLTVNKEVTTTGLSNVYAFTPSESGWYQIVLSGQHEDNYAGTWKTDTGIWTKGNTTYIEKGSTYYALADQLDADDTMTVKVQKVDVPTAIHIVPMTSADLVFTGWQGTFTLDTDDIQIEVEYGNAKRTLSGKDFRKTYGGNVNVTQLAAEQYHVVASVPGTDLEDVATLNTKTSTKKAYTTAADGTMTYVGTDSVKGFYNPERFSDSLIMADVFTFTPNKTGMYVMSFSYTGSTDPASCGVIVEKDSATVVRYSEGNTVYLEAGKTYYQALPYDIDDEYTLTLTPLDSYKSGCQHNYTSKVTKAATCKESGIMTYTCTKCGESYTETIAKLPHTEEILPAKAATCTETGLTEGKKCSVCGEILVAQKTIDKLAHTEEILPAKAVTCTEDGLTEGTKCSVCGEILKAQEVIPAKGHTEETIKGKEATCTEDGLTDGVKCSVCGEILKAQEEIPAKGHTIVIKEPKAATCTEAGYTEDRRCSTCGEVFAESKEIPAKGHILKTLAGKEATCTEDGLTEGKQCIVCGETTVEQEVIKATGHTEVTLEASDATCTTAGKTEGTKCSTCGEILKAQEVIPAKGHTIDLNVWKTSEDGTTKYHECSVCHTKFDETVVEKETVEKTETAATVVDELKKADEVKAEDLKKAVDQITEVDNKQLIAAKDNVMDTVTDLEALVTENNEKVEKTETAVSEDAAKLGITEAEVAGAAVTAAAQENVAEDIKVAAQLEVKPAENKYKDHEVAVDVSLNIINAETKDVVEEKVQPKTPISITLSIPTSCEDKVFELYHINDAGEYEIVSYTKKDGKVTFVATALSDYVFRTVECNGNHTPEVLEGKEKTCTEDGLTEGSKCAVCGIILVAQTVIPKGHTLETIPAVAPTCTKEGSTEGQKCTVCGTVTVEPQKIEKTDHVAKTVDKVEATCTEKGHEAGTACLVCGETLTGMEEIPAAGHKEEVKTAAKEATCTENGNTAEIICSVCKKTLQEKETIPATGHKEVVVKGKAATCTATGLTDGKKCSVCNKVTVPQTTIPALGHSYGNWSVTKAATTTAEGVETRTCTRCGSKETRTIAKIPSAGTLNATNFPLKVKQSATLKVNNMAAGDRVVSWKSANVKIATVNGAGKVTGKKKGNTTITATLASGRVLTATVKVQTAAVKTTGITVNTRNVTLSQNQSFQLVSVIAPFTSKDKLSYKTSNKKVATVSKNGKITAKKAGKTTITVKAGKKSVKVTVNVIGVKTTGISVNTTQLNLKVKKKATIKAYVTPKNSSEKVTYKSSNKKIATVDAKGKVTAKKAGTATITVTSGSKSVKVNVTVTK